MGWQDAPIVSSGAAAASAQTGGDAPAWAKAPVVAASDEDHSFLHEAGRQLGLTLRAGASGLIALPAIASDAITGPINAGLDAALGEGHGFRFQRAEAAANNLMTAAGVPQPKNAEERVVQDVVSGMTGAGGAVGVGKVLANETAPVAQAIGEKLAEGPALQLLSGGASGGAAGAAREEGAGPVTQFAAGMAGGLAPAAGVTAGEAALRGLIRGGEAGQLRAAENLATFQDAGTTPTLGQVTDNRVIRAAESGLAKTPGGAGVIANKAQQQADDMQAAVQALSDSLAPDANATNAGEAIVKGVGAFKDAFRTTQQKLYNQLDQWIPATSRIPATRTQEALADLNAEIPGAPALSQWFKNARLAGIESALKSDTEGIDAVLSRPGMADYVDNMRKNLTDQAVQAEQRNAEQRTLGLTDFDPVLTPEQIEDRIRGFLSTQTDGQLTYQAMKKLRTLVGNEIANTGLVSDVPRSKWNALYGALSDDLGDAAAQAGPKAEAAWNRANTYTRLHMDRLEQLSSVVNKDAPEKVFQAALSGTSEGNTTIARVMKSLPTDARKQVAAAVLQRLGRATPGQQTAEGDAFSSETFLTNLSKMSPAARQTVFGSTSVKGILDKVGDLAKVAGSRRDGGKVFANPSGTAGAAAQIGMATAIGGALTHAMTTGRVAPLVAAVAMPAVAYTGAKMLTGPAMVERAATRTPIPKGIAGAALASPVVSAGSVSRAQTQKRDADAMHALNSAKTVEQALQAAQQLANPKAVPQIDPKLFQVTPSGAGVIYDADGTAARTLREHGIPAVPMANGKVMVSTSRVKAARQVLGLE